MLVNLLPQKSSYVKKYQVDVMLLLCAILLPLAITIILHRIIMMDCQALKNRIESYRDEIASYQKISKTDSPVVQNDDVKRYQVSTENGLQLIGKSINENVCLTRLARHKNKLKWHGKASSVADLARALKRMESEHFFSEMNITRFERLATADPYIFEVGLVEGIATPMQELAS